MKRPPKLPLRLKNVGKWVYPRNYLAEAPASNVDGAKVHFLRPSPPLVARTTLSSMLHIVSRSLAGFNPAQDDPEPIIKELTKWAPQREEYASHIRWDTSDPPHYTRNPILSNEHMEALLMCWPPQSSSAIHCHGNSGCWVIVVEGSVIEARFQLPFFDHTTNSQGSSVRSGPLKLQKVTELSRGSGNSPVAYICNALGIHAIQNRTNQPALTLHIYAPGLRQGQSRIFTGT